MIFLAFQFICVRLPWDVEFRERMKFLVGNQSEQLRMYTKIRIEMFEQFFKQIQDQFAKKVPHISETQTVAFGELPNPFVRVNRILTMLNYQ